MVYAAAPVGNGLVTIQQFSVWYFESIPVVSSKGMPDDETKLPSNQRPGHERAAQTVPKLGFGFQSVPDLTKSSAATLLDLVYQKGEQHEQGENGRQVFRPVPVVVFEMAALVFQGIESLVFDLPATVSGAHHAFDGVRGERPIRNPGSTFDDALATNIVWLYGGFRSSPALSMKDIKERTKRGVVTSRILRVRTSVA